MFFKKKNKLSEPVGSGAQIIFETDFGLDADDLGALAMLHYYADQDFIDLLAIMSWTGEPNAAPAIAAVNRFYGRPKVPIGVREESRSTAPWSYNKVLADRFPHDPDVVANVVSAVTLYRQVLAKAEPRSITIVSVGPMANIRDLLQSPADETSELTGAELVDAKVDQFVIMGGHFPKTPAGGGAEWNFNGNMKGVTEEVIATIQRPIIFSGFEVGQGLQYGAALNQHPADTPLYVGYKHFSEHAPWMSKAYKGQILDNASYDQATVMFAAIGRVGEHWTLSAPGILTVDADGLGTWAYDAKGRHRFMILAKRTADAVTEIGAAMTH